MLKNGTEYTHRSYRIIRETDRYDPDTGTREPSWIVMGRMGVESVDGQARFPSPTMARKAIDRDIGGD
jgi:hypothetical protein